LIYLNKFQKYFLQLGLDIQSNREKLCFTAENKGKNIWMVIKKYLLLHPLREKSTPH